MSGSLTHRSSSSMRPMMRSGRRPSAQLAFHRMPYGFAVVTNAEIDNGSEDGAWRAEISASYRRESRSFSVSARINDLVPANVSDQIYALSKLARVKVPLSGHAEVEVTDQGVITKLRQSFQPPPVKWGFPTILPSPSSSMRDRSVQTMIRQPAASPSPMPLCWSAGRRPN